MDQKRTLWIVLAVGLFLLVVVGFALIIYAPERKSKQPLPPNQTTNDIWSMGEGSDFIPIYPENKNSQYLADGTLPSDSMQLIGSENAQNAQGLDGNASDVASAQNTNGNAQNLQVQDLTVISENTKLVANGQTIDLTGIINTVNQPTITKNENETAKSSSASSSKNASSSSYSAENNTAANIAKASSAPKNTSTASKSAPASAEKATTAQPVPPRYWIQASSYSSKKNAEEARNALSAENIPSEIFTFTDSKGTLFYRVRVGPYSTKSEAEYWQTRIKSISKFANTDTYITNSTAKAR